MTVLGLRCSNHDYAHAILKGTRTAPNVIVTGEKAFPKNYVKPQLLKWFMQEIEDLVRNQAVTAIAMKGPEGFSARGRPFVERIEIEAIVFLLGANIGIKPVLKKVKSTIAKDLGLKGKAKYLDTKLNTSVLSGFDSYTDKVKEAILAAWSTLS